MTKPRHTKQARLRAASRLIAEVAGELNMKHDVCPCCNLPRYEDWTHKRLHDVLSAMTEKLNRVASSDTIKEVPHHES